MKKYFNYILILSLTFSIISCDEENEINNITIDNNNNTELVGSLTLDNSVYDLGTPINYTIDLPQTFNYDAKITVLASRIEIADNSVSTIIIPAGLTSATDVLNLSLANLGFSGTKIKVKIDGITLFSDDEEVNVEDNYSLTSNEVEINVGGNTVIKLGWDDSSDLDIILRDPSGTTVDEALTGANPEIVSLADTLADGDYTLGVVYFSVEDSSLNYTFNVSNSAGSQVVTGNLEGYVASTSNEIAVFNINKSGSTITITEL